MTNYSELFDYLLRQREKSKWIPVLLTNTRISIFLSPFVLGVQRVEIPDFIKSNPSLHALDKNRNDGKPYNDSKCLFRCLALHRGAAVKNLCVATEYLYHQWLSKQNISHRNFLGVGIVELNDFEKIYKTRVNLFSLN